MNIILELVLYTAIFCKIYNTFAQPNKERIKELTSEERNTQCCQKNLGCCKKTTDPTNFEIRALVQKCVQSDCGCETPKKEKPEKKCDDDDDNEVDTEMKNCLKKLLLTIKVKNFGITNCKSQYIIVDHIFDTATDRKQVLLNPYIIKIRQNAVMQKYNLQYETVVNSEAKEKVINKNDPGYNGCNTSPNNPTCGVVKYKDKVVPYSTGFCCSCNSEDTRQTVEDVGFVAPIPADIPDSAPDIVPSVIPDTVPSAIPDTVPSPIPDTVPSAISDTVLSSPGSQPAAPEARQVDVEVVEASGDQGLKEAADNAGNSRRNDEESAPNDVLTIDIVKREVRGHVQKRGGQDCNDSYTPSDVDPSSYHASTHCLDFSDVWYSVYRFSKPRVDHALQLQIYEKFEDQEGKFHWIDLTGGSAITVGNASSQYSDDENTIMVNYKSHDIAEEFFSIKHQSQKLLIPETKKDVDLRQYPEVQGGPGEYLVVNSSQIRSNGKVCDKAGVGYEAFVKQSNRCSMPKNSCLQNQPKDMWLHDKKVEASGGRGCYFLKNYGVLPECPIKNCNRSESELSDKVLTLFFTDTFTSVVNIKLKADENVILRPNSLAIITEVYVDDSNPKRTSVIAKIFNSGLVSSILRVAITDCPSDLPASFNNIISKSVMIPPQRQHIYNLEIQCELPINNFYCSLEVLNTNREVVSLRKVRFRTSDRCICVWYCRCSCLAEGRRLTCVALPLDHYHAAGFQGGLPIPTHIVRRSYTDDMISLMMYVLLSVFLTLFIMGLIKAILGCFIVAIGLWGLDVILDLPKSMHNYYEHDIKGRKVMYNECGWPIHPDTKKRVRNIPLHTEFAINVIFFFIYPLSLALKTCCRSKKWKDEQQYSELDICECKQNQISFIRSASLQNSLTRKQNSRSSSNLNKSSSPDTSKKHNKSK